MDPNQIPTPPPSTPSPVEQSSTPTKQNQPIDSQSVTQVNVKYVGFGRLAALIIDGIIILVISFIILYFMYYPKDVDTHVSEEIIGLISIIYSVIFVTLYGATLGKMILKIKIVDKDYTKPPFWKIVLRESIGKSISGVLLPVSVLLVIFDKKKRSIHDFIASTYVIYK